MKALRCLECKQLLGNLRQYHRNYNGIGKLVLEGFCEKCMTYSTFPIQWQRFGEGSEDTYEGEVHKP